MRASGREGCARRVKRRKTALASCCSRRASRAAWWWRGPVSLSLAVDAAGRRSPLSHSSRARTRAHNTQVHDRRRDRLVRLRPLPGASLLNPTWLARRRRRERGARARVFGCFALARSHYSPMPARRGKQNNAVADAWLLRPGLDGRRHGSDGAEVRRYIPARRRRLHAAAAADAKQTAHLLMTTWPATQTRAVTSRRRRRASGA